MCIIIHACYIHQHDKADLDYRSAWHIHIVNGYIHFHRVKVRWLFVHFIKDLFDVMRQKDGSFLIEPMTPWIELPVLHHWPMTTGQPPAAHNPLYLFILQARATAWGLFHSLYNAVVERSHYTAKLSPLTVCTLMQQQKLMLLFLGSKKPGSVNFENWSCSSHYFLLYLLLYLCIDVLYT